MARRRGSWRTRRPAGLSGTVEAATLHAAITAHRPGGGPAPRYEGLHVTGTLDLSHCRLDTALALVDCVFEEPVDLTQLALSALDLSGSVLPALHADRVVVEGEVRLTGTRLGDAGEERIPLLDPATDPDGVRVPRRIQEGATAGVLRLADARIGGNLVAEELTVTGTAAWSLLAPRLTVGGSVHARGLKASGALYLGTRVSRTPSTSTPPTWAASTPPGSPAAAASTPTGVFAARDRYCSGPPRSGAS